MRNSSLIGLILFSLFINLIANEPIQIKSPDGKVLVELCIKEKLHPYPGGERLYYSVKFNGSIVLKDSPFGLDFNDMPLIAQNLNIIAVKEESVNETAELVWGENKEISNNYNAAYLTLGERANIGRKFNFIVRAYNDGVAFRYGFPKDAGFSEFKLSSEQMEFHFPSNHRVWAVDYLKDDPENFDAFVESGKIRNRESDWPGVFSGFYSHQESIYKEQFINHLSPNRIYGCPILVEVESNIWAALTEANLTDWAGMYFSHSPYSRNALVTVLSPRVDERDVLVKSVAPRVSPWRVLMLAESPGELIESNIIFNLNEPCAIEDPSWIEPGISAWDKWWSGEYIPDADFEIAMNNETMKYFIDFAAEMEWEYQLVDWTWYGPPFIENTRISNPESDITVSIPEIDIPELVEYAGNKNVKLFLWLEWEHVNEQMEKAFPLYEEWGIAGVKIDFMQRDDQEMVNFYHRTVKLAAKHGLMVDFHGSYKPTGWERTYPNFMTREGILGNEHSKWSEDVNPDHCLTLPFTRALIGHSDFTPGGFLNRFEEDFINVNRGPATQVMGTRCFQLAMMIVYFSPLQVMCDSPFNYRNFPDGLDFLKIVPTTWDETKVLHGEVGEYITIARRSGQKWFIGSMNDWTPRSLEINLDFLKNGRYTAEIWSDPEKFEGDPVNVDKQTITVDKSNVIYAEMSGGGGHIIVLSPDE